jgi:Flp pilus assembly protein protease CpaA
MENWMVLAGAVVVIACLYPPFLGVVMGAGAVVLLTVVIGKMMGA